MYTFADCITRVQKWSIKLSEYDYDVVYPLGVRNVVTDVLLNIKFYKNMQLDIKWCIFSTQRLSVESG